MTYDNRQFYIDGAWVDPVDAKELKVINPATEEVAGVISMGSSKDVDRAVMAARRAFDSYSRTSPAERLALLERILAAYKAHFGEIAQAISTEMGAPITLARAGRCVRPDPPLELADQSSRRQGCAGACRRMHHGAQALRVFALQRHHLGQGHARGGRAQGRI